MQRRIRILYTQQPTGGGSTRSLYELLCGLDRERFEPIVLFLEGSDYLSDFESLNIKIITSANGYGKHNSSSKRRNILNNKTNGRYSIQDNLKLLFLVDMPIALEVARIIKKYDVKLVHQNLSFNRGVMLGARIARVPQVHHFRLFGKYPKSAKVLMSADQHMISISKAVADHYIAHGIPQTQSSIIYNPIDAKRFTNTIDRASIREEFSVPDSDWLITNVGRITPWKGQMFFLEAMEILAGKYPNVSVLLVGSPGNDKDRAYMDKLHEFASKSIISDKVIFAGSRTDIPAIMKASDVIVHSASKPEPFGRVIVEAMLAGAPVVATDAGGVPEIIKDGMTGLLVPVKDAQAIASSVERLLKSHDLRRSISHEARAEAATRYTVGRHVNEVQKIYEKLCSKRLGRRSITSGSD